MRRPHATGRRAPGDEPGRLQLIVLGYASLVSTTGMSQATTAVVVSRSGGALLADLVSVTLLVDLFSTPRR